MSLTLRIIRVPSLDIELRYSARLSFVFASRTMKGHSHILRQLNLALFQRLTAINQYFLHAKMLKNWGLDELAEPVYRASIQAMKHADALAERILFLEGLPNFQALGKLRIAEAPQEVIACDLALEHDTLPILREGIAQCEQAEEFVSRALLVGMLETEEEHVDWLETQQDLIERIGLANYLQSQMEE